MTRLKTCFTDLQWISTCWCWLCLDKTPPLRKIPRWATKNIFGKKCQISLPVCKLCWCRPWCGAACVAEPTCLYQLAQLRNADAHIPAGRTEKHINLDAGGYGSWCTSCESLAIAPSLGVCSGQAVAAEIFFLGLFLWEESGWLLGVSDVADYYKVHSALKLEVVTKLFFLCYYLIAHLSPFISLVTDSLSLSLSTLQILISPHYEFEPPVLFQMLSVW